MRRHCGIKRLRFTSGADDVLSAESGVLIAALQIAAPLSIVAHNFRLEAFVNKFHRGLSRSRGAGQHGLRLVSIAVGCPVHEFLRIVGIKRCTLVLSKCGHAAEFVAVRRTGRELMVLALRIVKRGSKLLNVTDAGIFGMDRRLVNAAAGHHIHALFKVTYSLAVFIMTMFV